MYRHPELTQREFPIDASVINMAIRQALDSNEDNRDVRPLKSLLARALSITPKMYSHELRRRSYISAAAWDIIPSEGFEEDPKAFELAENARRRLKQFIKSYPKRFIKGDLFGESVLELAWTQKKIGVVPSVNYSFKSVELEANPNYNFGVVWLAEKEYGRFVRQEIPIEDRHNHIIYIPEFEEPGGLLRTIVYSAYMINLSRQEWTRFIQLIKGIIHTTVEDGASPEDTTAAVDATKSAVKSQAAVTSKLVDFDWKQLTNGDSYKAYKEILESCDEVIENALTNVYMSPTNKDRNAQTVQERSAEDVAKEIRSAFEDVLNDQLLQHDYYMNVDKSEWGKEMPYEFKISVKVKQDRVSNATILFELIDKGIPIKVSEFEEKVGVNLAMDSDDIITIDFATQLKDQFNQDEADDEDQGNDSKN